jgi:FixJ family two-component response regulator
VPSHIHISHVLCVTNSSLSMPVQARSLAEAEQRASAATQAAHRDAAAAEEARAALTRKEQELAAQVRNAINGKLAAVLSGLTPLC